VKVDWETIEAKKFKEREEEKERWGGKNNRK